MGRWLRLGRTGRRWVEGQQHSAFGQRALILRIILLRFRTKIGLKSPSNINSLLSFLYYYLLRKGRLAGLLAEHQAIRGALLIRLLNPNLLLTGMLF